MSDLYDQIVSQRGSFERLVARLPGFGGYVDKDARRQADRMLRDHIAELISQRIQRLTQIEKSLLDAPGGMSYMSKTGSIKTKMQTYHDRIKAQAPGYAGFFDAIKIREAELEKLYSFDEAQASYADKFGEALESLAAAVTSGDKSAIDQQITALDKLTIEANDALSLRNDVLTNLSNSTGA
jgi:hypothetical protein